jgi:diguanylate cyclase
MEVNMSPKDPASELSLQEAVSLHDLGPLSVRDGAKRLLAIFDLDVDGLTQLPSHPQFNRRLGALLKDPATKDIAIFHIDLDDFKSVNDALGHENGNQFLKAIAKKLQEFPFDGLNCRSGGDEFPIAFTNLGSKMGAVTLALQLWDHISGEVVVPDLRTKRRGKKVSWKVSPSIGVFWTSNPQEAVDRLSQQRRNPHMAFLDRADSATYDAKRLPPASGPRVVHYSTELQRKKMRAQSHENSLRRALQDRDLVKVYQPICDLSSSQIQSYETMIRLGRSSGSRRTLERNMLLMESWPEFVDLFAYILEGACSDLQGLGRQVNVNMPVAQLLSDDLLSVVARALNRSCTKPAEVVIEVSERQAIPLEDDVFVRLDELKQLGIGLAIDDYGVGHANAERLLHFPQFSSLKIDKSVVQQAPTNSRARALLSSTINLAHDFGMTVTAEGVETKRQFELVKSLDCDFGQGYYIAHPQPIEAIRSAG